jgi:hypothetical protein
MSPDPAEQKISFARQARADKVHFRHILVGIDFSDSAARALEVAISHYS